MTAFTLKKQIHNYLADLVEDIVFFIFFVAVFLAAGFIGYFVFDVAMAWLQSEAQGIPMPSLKQIANQLLNQFHLY